MAAIETLDDLLKDCYPGIWAWLKSVDCELSLLHKPLLDVIRSYAIDLRGIWYFDLGLLVTKYDAYGSGVSHETSVSLVTPSGARWVVDCRYDPKFDDSVQIGITRGASHKMEDPRNIALRMSLESVWQFIHGERPRELTRGLGVLTSDDDEHIELCDTFERVIHPRLMWNCISLECRDAAIQRAKRLNRKRRRTSQ
jgi:hypothetical protein